MIPQSFDILKLTWPWPTGHERKYLNKESQSQGLDLLPEMQLHLNGPLGSAAVLGGLKDTVKYVCRARTGLLPSKAGVKSHHGMGNQVDGLGLIGKALIEQFTFLEVKSKRKKADKMLNSPPLKNYVKLKTIEQNHKYSYEGQ